MIGKIAIMVLAILFVAKALNLPSSTSVSPLDESSLINNRPIIGILAQDLGRSMRKLEYLSVRNYTSYIASSYVKFIESAGARVVPIKINQPDAYYEKLSRSLNGFLIPGGGASITDRSGYGRAGKMIYDLILNQGAKNNPTPLWGTCLGFEMLVYLIANEVNPLTRCNARNLADTLQLQPDYAESKLFDDIPSYLENAMQTKNITSNFHKYCVTPETFENLNLKNSLLLLSTTLDSNDIEYVSTIEHKTFPMYGTQWHPEKAAFEWSNRTGHNSIPHDIDAIRLSQYLGETFVQEARKNKNRFESETEEQDHLIYNYSPVFVQKLYRSSFQQCYFF